MAEGGTSEVDVLDPALRLRFVTGLCLVQRDRSTLQIGSDPPRCVVVHNAPPGAAELLKALDGNRSTHQVLVGLSERHRVDPTSWTRLLTALVSAGFLSAMRTDSMDQIRPDSPSVRADRQSLIVRYGPAMADQAMRNRNEAVVQVLGAGRVAASLASMLAGAGVGHIYVEPARLLRPTDVCAAGVGQAGMSSWSAAPASPAVQRSSERRTTEPARRANPRRAKLVSDRLALAAVVQRVAPDIAVHPPTGYVPPNVVVLAGDGTADTAAMKDLHRRGLAHLAVQTDELKAVVGPLVVPGRTSCVNCAHLHRTDNDPGWPLVLLALSKQSAVPASTHAATAAATAAAQVLQFLDGLQTPDTMDGTLEWDSDSWQVRRRSWSFHPRCDCRR